MDWQSFLFLVVAGATFGYATYRFVFLYRLMTAQTGSGFRLGHIPERIKAVFVNVIGQKAVLREKKAGIMHATIFWGFLIITVGTLEQFVTTLYRPWNFEFIGHVPYRMIVFLQDFFTLGVLVAVIYAFYRRLIVRPSYLGQSKDANFILLLTGALMISIFLMNGFNILGLDLWFKSSMPFSLLLASGLEGLHLDVQTHQSLGTLFKWVHMLIVLGFLVYIPSSKHLHVIAAGPNTFFKNIRREKPMSKINFEDESLEQYGAAKISHLSWKDTLDYYSCTECGRCQNLCPAWNTEKPLSPKNLIIDLKENLYRNQKGVLAKKEDEISPILDESITPDVIWACTSCRACEIACPVFIGHTDKIYDIRRNLVMMESKFPQEVQTVFKNMETNATPWAFSASDRAAWAEGLSVSTMAENSEIDVLLWVGCAGSYDDRNKKVLRAFVNVLKKAGVRFSILGQEEQCTGDPARRIGNEYLFQTLAQANVETLNRYNVKKIVTACPHCFNTLKNEYGDFGGNYDVVHHSQYIAQLISEGKIKPTKSIEDKITFHDSCYLGRWNGEYSSPRKIIESIPSAQLTEMKMNHDQSMCCGAGGGRMWMEETIGKRINITRTEQALETKADIIGAACPFCMTMMNDGVKSKELQDKVRVADVAELIDEATPSV